VSVSRTLGKYEYWTPVEGQQERVEPVEAPGRHHQHRGAEEVSRIEALRLLAQHEDRDQEEDHLEPEERGRGGRG
jgi:hypothetical protein